MLRRSSRWLKLRMVWQERREWMEREGEDTAKTFLKLILHHRLRLDLCLTIPQRDIREVKKVEDQMVLE